MRHRFIRIAIFIVSIFLIINLSRSLFDLWKKGGALDREEERFAKVRFENEELTREYDKLQSPEYIEREAREKLGLARPGETVVVLPQTTPVESKNDLQKSQKESNLPIWRQWIEFLIN